MKTIYTPEAPQPVGPYSQAIEVNGTVYCSGQIALDPKTGKIVGINATEQVEQVIKNMKAVLKAGGLSIKNVVKTTIFMVDLGEFADVNAVYEEMLEGHKPARSTIQVSALPKGGLIEIECVAVR